MPATPNFGILELHAQGLVDANPEWFAHLEAPEKRRRAFLLVAVARSQGVSYEEALESVLAAPSPKADAGNATATTTDEAESDNTADADAVIEGDPTEGVLPVMLCVLGDIKDIDEREPGDGDETYERVLLRPLRRALRAAELLFDPYAAASGERESHAQREAQKPRDTHTPAVTARLLPRLEAVRSRLREGFLPRVRVLWLGRAFPESPAVRALVEEAETAFPGLTVEFLELGSVLRPRRRKATDRDTLPTGHTGAVFDQLQLSGAFFVEDLDFKRVLVGRVHVREILRLCEEREDLFPELANGVKRFEGPDEALETPDASAPFDTSDAAFERDLDRRLDRLFERFGPDRDPEREARLRFALRQSALSAVLAQAARKARKPQTWQTDATGSMDTTGASGPLFFLTDGITLLCESLSFNASLEENTLVKLGDMRFLNGRDLCLALRDVAKAAPLVEASWASVPIRIVQAKTKTSKDGTDDWNAFATRNADVMRMAAALADDGRSPSAFWRDLRALSPEQKQLEADFRALGVRYLRERDAVSTTNARTTIPAPVLAEAVLSIWRGRPRSGRFLRSAHFGAFYELVFRDLTAAQGLLAVLIFRKVEDRRRAAADCEKIDPALSPFLSCLSCLSFLPFATGHIAMLVGEALLRELGRPLTAVTEHTFPEAQATLEATFEKLYAEALARVREAVTACERERGGKTLNVRELAAVFRCGEVLEKLRETGDEREDGGGRNQCP